MGVEFWFQQQLGGNFYPGEPGEKSFDGFPVLPGITKPLSLLIIEAILFLFVDENKNMQKIYSLYIYL